ncbi:MAG: outer membrane protein OmpA-like peptidoglycan-associated protein [Myxococcota bacterium]
MGRAIPILVGTALVAALTYFCVQAVRGPIELDLTGRAALALKDAGIKGVLVGAEGRTLTLRGPVSDSVLGAKARQTVAAVWGVEVVEDAMEVAVAPTKAAALKPTPPDPTTLDPTTLLDPPDTAAPGAGVDPSVDPTREPAGVAVVPIKDLPPIIDNGLLVRVVREDDGVALVGGAPDAASKARWLAAAVKVYGEKRVRDALTVEKTPVSPTLDAGVLAVIPWVATIKDGLGVVTPQVLSLTGESKEHGKTMAVRNAWVSLPQNYDLQIEIAIPGETARHRCQVKINALLAKRPIAFKEDEPGTLSKRSRSTVRDVAKVLAKCAKADVYVESHTDNSNTMVKNLALSQDRSEAVVARLVRGGVDKGRLIAHGVGAEQPIGDNRKKAGRALNERIEIRVERTGMH